VFVSGFVCFFFSLYQAKERGGGGSDKRCREVDMSETKERTENIIK